MKLYRLFTLPIVFYILTVLMSESVSAQQIPQTGNASENSDWISLMQDENARFQDVCDVFYKYWEGRTDYKGNGWKVFKRWEYINESRVLPDGKLQTPGYVLNEYTRYMKNYDPGRSASGNWTLVGPSAYPVNGTSQPTGMGRVNAIAFHPADANIIYIGSPSGGIWKTTDGGLTWVNLSSNLPTLGVSSILIHPTNPDIIYIGTGDRDADDAPGIGVYKSTDGGMTWNQSSTGMGDKTVGAMIMHPTDPNIILAATSGGIYKTTDGGATWSQKLTSTFKDIKFKPGDPAIVYATYASSSGARLYRSGNTGNNWTHITSGIPNAGTAAAGARMVIGVSPANPTYVYLVQIQQTNKNFQSLLRSTDSGLNFSTRSSSPNIMDYSCDGSGTASQATYDLCVTVDPGNADIVYVGSINNWKSTDGGVTWTIISHWLGSTYGTTCAASLHADQHVYEWSSLNGNLYVGHDGGLYSTANGGTAWTNLSDGLAINQIYKIGQSATTDGLVIFGQQDNGTAVSSGNTITTVIGGDGTESAIDYTDPGYRYGCYVMGDLKRSVNSSSYNPIAESVNGITEGGPWVTPYLLHETDPNTMFAGFQNVWRTNNLKATSNTAVSWTAISTGETADCSVLEQSPADVNVLYVVRDGEIQRTDNANDAAASVTWTYCSLPDGYTPSDLEAHPTDPDIIYATAGYTVYVSDDKGITWTDMDPNYSLPALFINCLVYDENSNEGIYIGNQTGVWYKDAGMTDWMLFSTGLPPVDIRELEIFYDPVGTQNRIKAATYGRGLWQSDLIETGILNPTGFIATARSQNQIHLDWSLNPGNNSVILAYNTTPSFGIPVDGTSYAESSTIPGGGTVLFNGNGIAFDHTSLAASTTYYYKLWSYDGNTVYSSGTTANTTTFCTLISSFPWSEGFEHGGSLPSCWTQEYVNSSNPWEMKTAGTNSHPASAHTGTYLARDRSLVVNSNYVTKFVSPPINLYGLAATLTFWHTQEAWSGRQDELRVYYKTSISGAWNLLSTYTNSIAAWTQETIILPNPSSTYFIAFQATVNAGYGICIDDLQISGTYNISWTGAISTDWNNGGNWSGGFVPVSLNNVTIPDVANDPVIDSPPGNPATCSYITIEPGATIRVQPGSSFITVHHE
jgi:photosystem II stability/assembly factor-like uncharacterized protein